MYRFIRTAVVKTGASQPLALQYASEVTSYVKKAHGLDLKYGLELFGEARVHWHFDIDSVDKALAANAKLMQDREYAGLLERGKALWTEGTMKAAIVFLAG